MYIWSGGIAVGVDFNPDRVFMIGNNALPDVSRKNDGLLAISLDILDQGCDKRGVLYLDTQFFGGSDEKIFFVLAPQDAGEQFYQGIALEASLLVEPAAIGGNADIDFTLAVWIPVSPDRVDSFAFVCLLE